MIEGMQDHGEYQRMVKCPQNGILMSKPDGNGGPKGYGNLSSQIGIFNLNNIISIYCCQLVSNLFKPV
jgi:hypothetical protein